MGVQAIEFEWAWVEGEWQPNVLVIVDREGKIETVFGAESTRPTRIESQRVDGLAIPGLLNVHSHAFQRGLAGATEFRTAERDSFWTWRSLMYHFVDQLSPDDMYVLARQAFLDMLRGGYTAVGEFHYVHNDRDGRPYRQGTTLGDAVLAAAADVGIRICLLPVLYQLAGFGGKPLESRGQRRFALSIDDWLSQIESLSAANQHRPEVSIGAALHSLRAVDLAAAREALDGLAALDFRGPIHMHISEQQREVDECLAWCGRRPIQLALDQLPVDSQWTLIHATHAESSELAGLAATGATIGVCPTTEANLGDGVFRAADWLAAPGKLGIGSDSQIGLNGAGELRMLEYCQRLQMQQRVVLRRSEWSCGESLFEIAAGGGAQSLQLPAGAIAPEQFADFVVLDSRHSTLGGLPPRHWLDAWIFADAGDLVQEVWVGGKRRVVDRTHVHDAESRNAFRETRRRILSTWSG